MSNDWNPKLPKCGAICVICGEKVTSPPFVASKPRRGNIIYAHTECLKAEQKESMKKDE